MGLFIGASILTVLEILDYIYEVRSPHTHPHKRIPQSEMWPSRKETAGLTAARNVALLTPAALHLLVLFVCLAIKITPSEVKCAFLCCARGLSLDDQTGDEPFEPKLGSALLKKDLLMSQLGPS